jgi:hypothetical protein
MGVSSQNSFPVDIKIFGFQQKENHPQQTSHQVPKHFLVKGIWSL